MWVTQFLTVLYRGLLAMLTDRSDTAFILADTEKGTLEYQEADLIESWLIGDNLTGRGVSISSSTAGFVGHQVIGAGSSGTP